MLTEEDFDLFRQFRVKAMGESSMVTVRASPSRVQEPLASSIAPSSLGLVATTVPSSFS